MSGFETPTDLNPWTQSEELCAWVRFNDGESATSEELRAWCAGKIATYKIPRYWRPTESFPMTVTGKVQKYLMRQKEIEERGLQKASETKTA